MPNKSDYDHVITLDLDEMLYIGSDIRLFPRLTKSDNQDITIFVLNSGELKTVATDLYKRYELEETEPTRPSIICFVALLVTAITVVVLLLT